MIKTHSCLRFSSVWRSGIAQEKWFAQVEQVQAVWLSKIGRTEFAVALVRATAFFAIERQNVLRQSGKFFCYCATGSFASEQLDLVLERDGVYRSTVSSGSLAC